jgi:Mg2+/citrate symporter
MDFLLSVLALLGAAAIVARLIRAVLAAALGFAERTAAAGMAEASRRRGDLTALAEMRERERQTRRRSRWSAALAIVWLALLVVPPLLNVAGLAYAAAAALWLLPRRPLRATPPAATIAETASESNR